MPPKKSSKVKKKELSRTGEEADKICQRFLKTYEQTCGVMSSIVSSSVRAALRQGIDDAKFVKKLILEAIPVNSLGDQTVMVEPLLTAMRKERYNYIKSLHIWQIPLTNREMSSLGMLLDKGIYDIVHLDLLDNMIQPYGLQRVAISINTTKSITSLSLDYNEFGDEGMKYLYEGLVGNITMLKLSLNYCGLTENSAAQLAMLISTTALMEVYLDGNDLGCPGVQQIIMPLVMKAEEDMSLKREQQEAKLKLEDDARLAAEAEAAKHKFSARDPSPKPGATSSDKKKKKGKKGKKTKEPPSPPPVGAFIQKLHLADNGIDPYGENYGDYIPLQTMRYFRRLIINSEGLQEIDLEDNLIGDMGGSELLEGLLERKEVHNFSNIKLRTTHRMKGDTLKDLIKLGGGALKKKKKGAGKKKKK